MSVEEVARDFVTTITDPEMASPYLTTDAVASGGVLPQPIPAEQALDITEALTTAFPDLKFDIQHVSVNGNQATVDVRWSGTNTGPLSLPGMPSVPTTGKKVSVKDRFVVTVQGDKVSHLDVESPPDGGIPAALKQLGVQAPGM